MGIEPTTSAWKAEVLPVNYTRIYEKSLTIYLTSITYILQRSQAFFAKFVDFPYPCYFWKTF